MTAVLKVKLILVVLGVSGCGLLVVQRQCDQAGKPRQLNVRQAAMVDSLKSAAPTHKDLK